MLILALALAAPTALTEAHQRDIACVVEIAMLADMQKRGVADGADVQASGRRWAGIVGDRITFETGQPRELVAVAMTEAATARASRSPDSVALASCAKQMTSELAMADAASAPLPKPLTAMTLRPFHLAFPVHDLAEARRFYGDVMGCAEGRSSDQWIDFDFFGHQIVAHLDPSAKAVTVRNEVDGHHVPVPHFGVVLTMKQWEELAERMKAAGVDFGIAPYIRFKGEAGEQATMFFCDPSGNALEFKAFADDSMLFAT